MRLRTVLVLIAALTATLAGPVSASSGPRLTVPWSKLNAALRCPTQFTHGKREPVLLVHGTNVTPEENWGWNYGHVLPDLGYDVCTVALPSRARVDAQVSVLVAGGQAGLYGGSSSAFFNGNDNTDHEPPLVPYART